MNDKFKARRTKLAHTVLKDDEFLMKNTLIEDDEWMPLKRNLIMTCVNIRSTDLNLSGEEISCIHNYLKLKANAI